MPVTKGPGLRYDPFMHGRAAAIGSMLILSAACPVAAPAQDQPLRVRTTEALAPCVRAAADAYTRHGRTVLVDVGTLSEARHGDAMVGGSTEVTRAIEGGHAVEGSDLDVAHIPWVLAVRAEGESRVDSLDDLLQGREEIWVFGGSVGYEARRALQGLPAERLHLTTDLDQLAQAEVAVLPLSLAAGTPGPVLEIPPILARAVVAADSGAREAAGAFVRFLGSADGREAFSICGNEGAR